jgi:uncharacterized protein (DUF2267 family)
MLNLQYTEEISCEASMGNAVPSGGCEDLNPLTGSGEATIQTRSPKTLHLRATVDNLRLIPEGGGERMDRSESPDSTSAGTGLDPFVRALEQQRILPSGMGGTEAAAAVLCVLAQRLSRGEARDVVVALPEGLRLRVQVCARHRGERGEAFDYDEFLRRVMAHLDVSRPEAEDIVRAVFAAVRRMLPLKEQQDVASQLPWDLEQLWRSA